ncbi:SAF domain-containing protein [Fodinicola acaciae]|uniref:SAF domain-containing protein n=1 Tax=Fodinicola acaciae TaxID=2681555 RepID=UPI0013D5519B|nr:SAF domain-containing protein [Fodinicola acaciae]
MTVRERDSYTSPASTPSINGKGDGLPLAWRRRVPWLLTGLLAMTLGIAGVLTVVSASNERRAVWAAVRDLPAGHVLAVSDVRVIQVGADADVPLIPASHRTGVIGARLATAIQAGAPLTTRQLGAPAWPPASKGVVGVAVDAGEYPPRIQPGDHVAVLLDPIDQQTAGAVDPDPSASTSRPDASTLGVRERVDATVVGVTPTDLVGGTQASANTDRAGRVVVTLQTSERGAAMIASAPGARLIAVSGDGG